jgi:hypothetical protein
MPSSLRFDHDGRELTLDQLSDFIDDCRRAKVPKGNPIRAELTKDGRIRMVEVLLEPDAD